MIDCFRSIDQIWGFNPLRCMIYMNSLIFHKLKCLIFVNLLLFISKILICFLEIENKILILRLFLNYTEWGCHSDVFRHTRVFAYRSDQSLTFCCFTYVFYVQFCSLCPMQQIVRKRNPSIREYAHTTIRVMGQHSGWRRHNVSWQLIENFSRCFIL